MGKTLDAVYSEIDFSEARDMDTQNKRERYIIVAAASQLGIASQLGDANLRNRIEKLLKNEESHRIEDNNGGLSFILCKGLEYFSSKYGKVKA